MINLFILSFVLLCSQFFVFMFVCACTFPFRTIEASDFCWTKKRKQRKQTILDSTKAQTESVLHAISLKVIMNIVNMKKAHTRNESLCNESIDNELNHKIDHHLFTDWKVIACAHLKVWDNLTDRESSVGWLPIEIKREINIHERTHNKPCVCVWCVYLPVLLFEMCPGWCVPTSNEATTTCWAVDHSYRFNLGYCFHSVEYFRFSLFQHHRRQIYFYGQFSCCVVVVGRIAKDEKNEV